MESTRTAESRPIIEAKVLRIEHECDLIEASVSPTVTTQIATDPAALLAYISNLIKLESNIYSVKQRLTTLYTQQIQNSYDLVRSKNLPVYNIRRELLKLDEVIASKNESIAHLRQEKIADPASIRYPAEPPKPVLRPIGKFDFLVGNKAKNERMEAEYDSAMAFYRERVEEINQQKRVLEEKADSHYQKIAEAQAEADEAKNNKIQLQNDIEKMQQTPELYAMPALTVKTMLENEIEQAEELLKKLVQARNKLYAYNVIYDKYRNWVAISSFYEYLASKRCSSLEGTNGAYNIYEAELRANLIVGKLSDILDAVEKIRDTQYMVVNLLEKVNSRMRTLNDTMSAAYDAIQDIRTNTNDLGKHLERIAENSEVIAHNTAVTAYYSKINAELTDSLGYMVAFS